MIVGGGVQLSVAVGVPKTGVEGHCIVVLAGHVITGSSVSFTVIVKLQVAFGVHPFVAVMETVVTPLLKVEPEPLPDPLPVVAPVKTYDNVGVGVPVEVTV